MSDIISDSSTNADTMEDVKAKRKEFMTGGLSGLCNLGNTCYMNSSLQCLLATDILIPYFRGDVVQKTKKRKHHDDDEDDDKSDTSKFYAPYKNDLKSSIIKGIADEKKKTRTHDEKITISMKEVRKKFKDSLTYKFRNLIVIMWMINCKVKPKEFKKKMCEIMPIFRGSTQNDSHECLLAILDTIHEETKTDVIVEIKPLPRSIEDFKFVMNEYLKSEAEISDPDKKKELSIEKWKYRMEHLREDAITKGIDFWLAHLKKNHSVITDIFTGLFFGQVKCQNCSNVSFRYEPFNIINLTIPTTTRGEPDLTLDDCLEKYFNCDEHLTGDNKYECDNCAGKHDATKQILLWYPPPRLVIQLKRFLNDEIHTFKNDQMVKFPITGLNIRKYVTEYVDGEYMYDLYAVSHHSGSLSGGHYVAYTKNPINNEWYLFDDSNVLHIGGDIESKLQTSGAYILFYKKREDVELTPSISDDELSKYF